MENNNVSDSSSSKGLVNELLEGRDLAKKLQFVVANEPNSNSSSNETYGLLAKNILAKFEKSLQILQYDPTNLSSQLHHRRITIGRAESPSSFNGSPKSQDSDGDFKDTPVDHKEDSKKRRLSPRVTQRVQGCTSSGLEGPIEDGYNWRKYGQKDILGANFPRAYYRCTHRTFQGCLATKQVQRSDDDPSFFEVTYRGKHSCSQASSSSSSASCNPTPKLELIETHQTIPQQHSKIIIWDFGRESNVEDIKPNINHTKTTTFSFPCSSNLMVDTHQQQNSTTILNYNNDNFVRHDNFPTNTNTYSYQSSPSLMMNNSFNDDHPQGQGTSDSASAIIAPSDVQFDYQGEFDNQFLFENPPYYE